MCLCIMSVCVSGVQQQVQSLPEKKSADEIQQLREEKQVYIW